MGSDTSGYRLAGRALIVGITFFLISIPIIIYTLLTLKPFNSGSSSAGNSTEAESMFADIIMDIIQIATTGVSAVGFILLAVGAVLAMTGGAYFVRRPVVYTLKLMFATRRGLSLWAISIYAVTFVAHDGVRFASLEIARVVLATTTVFAVSAMLFMRLGVNVSPGIKLLVVGPALLSSVFLSVISGMLASTVFNNFIIRVTDELVRFMLQDVLAIIGLNTVLSSIFELQGIGYLLVWVGVVIVAGWLLGFGLVTFDVSVSTNIRRFVRRRT